LEPPGVKAPVREGPRTADYQPTGRRWRHCGTNFHRPRAILKRLDRSRGNGAIVEELHAGSVRRPLSAWILMPNLRPRNVFYLSHDWSPQCPWDSIRLRFCCILSANYCYEIARRKSCIRNQVSSRGRATEGARCAPHRTRHTRSEIDHVWATEARKRWNAYKAGKVATVSYQELMAKYSR